MSGLDAGVRLVCVFALLGAVLWLLRRTAGRTARRREVPLQVLSTTKLGKSTSLSIVRVRDEEYVLGVSGSSVTVVSCRPTGGQAAAGSALELRAAAGLVPTAEEPSTSVRSWWRAQRNRSLEAAEVSSTALARALEQARSSQRRALTGPSTPSGQLEPLRPSRAAHPASTGASRSIDLDDRQEQVGFDRFLAAADGGSAPDGQTALLAAAQGYAAMLAAAHGSAALLAGGSLPGAAPFSTTHTTTTHATTLTTAGSAFPGQVPGRQLVEHPVLEQVTIEPVVLDHPVIEHGVLDHHPVLDRAVPDRRGRDHAVQGHAVQDHAVQDHRAEDRPAGRPASRPTATVPNSQLAAERPARPAPRPSPRPAPADLPTAASASSLRAPRRTPRRPVYSPAAAASALRASEPVPWMSSRRTAGRAASGVSGTARDERRVG